MALTDLFGIYQKDERINGIRRHLEQSTKGSVHLRGLQGSQLAFVIKALYESANMPCLVVAQDKETAAYLQNDLEQLATPALLFPDSLRRPYQFDRIEKINILQRTEVAGKLLGRERNPGVVVSYPEALFEKVVAPEALEKSVIEIRKGSQLDLAFVTEILREYGFVQTDFVYEPGQYSVRGGIVDIFSYGNSLPYRVELFDEDIESIRAFDPTSQLSMRNIERVTIVPNVNTQFTAAHKRNLIDIMGAQTLVWVQDLLGLCGRIDEGWEALQKQKPDLETLFREEGLDEEAQLLHEQAFSTAEEVRRLLLERRLVEYGAVARLSAPTVFDLGGSPQPSLGKNFNRLIENLQEHQKQGIANYIFAENPKQLERFEHIFSDLQAQVQWVPVPLPLHAGFIDQAARVAVYTDHQLFERFHKYKTKQAFDKNEALKIKALGELKPGDFVTHIDHGVGRYAGLEKIVLNGKQQEAVKLIYKDGDKLYVGIQSLHKISKYTGKDDEQPSMHKLGSNVWENTKRKAKKQLKELAFDLIKLYARRKATPGFAFPEDGYLQEELEASFIYEDTPDQAKATEDVKRDLMRPYPMDRLVCGDVGFGKTEVAIRAAFKAITAGKQVAVLVPTTILALQHARTFNERLSPFGVKIDYVNRFRTSKEKNAIYKQVESGELDLLIGTHALLNQKVVFKDLGLLVIDEEQKFGVGTKEKLRTIKVNVDTLTLTATPIPRTLQFSLLAARDLSIINTPPPNRQPIHTEVRTFDEQFLREAMENEAARGGQVFFIHNRVESLPAVCAQVRRLCPGLSVAMAHGQMEAEELETTLLDFIKGHHDVLVCTNIIETGLDIPNANTIIVTDAHRFGLSDLHQLRGRVGRSNRKAYCYLIAPSRALLSADAKKRLDTVEQFAELGSGFQIAMRDLDIRGAGNLLGAEQSGFIINMGYETYQKILNEAIMELKEEEYKELFAEELESKGAYISDVNIETDAEMLIPDAYVASIEERLSLYQKLDRIEEESGIETFRRELEDRFGKTPPEVENLFDALRVRRLAKRLGFERIVLSGGKLRCYFVANPNSYFYTGGQFDKLLALIQRKTDHRFFLKQSDKHLFLVVDGVKSMEKCKQVLSELATAP